MQSSASGRRKYSSERRDPQRVQRGCTGSIWQSAASFPRHRRVRARSAPLRAPQPSAWPPRSVRPPPPLESPLRCTPHLSESSGKRERRIRMPYSARQYIGTCMLRRRLTQPRPKALSSLHKTPVLCASNPEFSLYGGRSSKPFGSRHAVLPTQLVVWPSSTSLVLLCGTIVPSNLELVGT